MVMSEHLSQHLKPLNSIEKTQPWIMCAKFNGNPCSTIISNASDITTFYDGLSSLADEHITKHNVLIINGDMNAQISKNENYKFILHNLWNRNGEYLIIFHAVVSW